jgi:glycosyltransferase involved in cell wall biosynthesis
MRMKETTVLIGTHYFAHHGGGIERVAGELAKAYADMLGMNVVWVASDCDVPPPEAAKLHMLPMPSWNGIERIIGLPYPIWSPFAFRRLWRYVGLANVVHIHDFLYFGNLLILLFAAARNKPVLITQHIGLIPYESKMMRGTLSLLNRTLGSFILRHAEQVIFVSEVVQTYFSAMTQFRSRPRVIPNGLDPEIFHVLTRAKRDAKREALDIPVGGTVLLFVGRFVEKKGLAILKELAHDFADCVWIFAGEGPILPAAWTLANVRVFPKLPQMSLASLYQVADLLVLPSKGEGFPLVVQEAMACGTPAMVGLETAVALSGLSDLVFSADAESKEAVTIWKAKLRVIIERPSALTDLRTRVADYARNEWSWQKCAATYATDIRRIQVSA